VTAFTLHDGPRFLIRAYPRHEALTWTDRERGFMRLVRGDAAARLVDAYIHLRETRSELEADAALGRMTMTRDRTRPLSL